MIEEVKRKGLGRGLSALMQEDALELSISTKQTSIQKAPVANLVPNPDQPRRNFDEEELNELAQSIRINGIIMPILVRNQPDAAGLYEIIAGERRWRAAQLVQLHDVPIIIKDVNDKELAELSLIENIQRTNLNPIEEANGYRSLIQEYEHTQEELSQIVGKSRSYIANILRLLNLPEEIKTLIIHDRLTQGHGRVLLQAKNPLSLAKNIVANNLSVREVERLVQKERSNIQNESTRTRSPKDVNSRALETQLSNSLGLTVTIAFKGEAGKISVQYHNLEQLDDIVRRLQAPVET